MKSREEILSTIAEIDNLLKSLDIIVSEAVEKHMEFSFREPDRFSLRALGSLIHDFYTNIEDIFELISVDINGAKILDTFDWHKRLLTRMAIPIPDVRPPLISEELKIQLEEYLKFRHGFRNVYGYLLEWKRMKPLLDNLESAYKSFRKEIEDFKKFLLEVAYKIE
ncbi:hypothetical protein H5T89_11315 [bacterium]|nr:hypothetical protein [bacterium]